MNSPPKSILLELQVTDLELATHAFECLKLPVITVSAMTTHRITIAVANKVLGAPFSVRARSFHNVQSLTGYLYTIGHAALRTSSCSMIVLFDNCIQDVRGRELWDMIVTNRELSNEERENPNIFSVANGTGNGESIVVTHVDPVFRYYSDEKEMKIVSVNGTFDHLHYGHKTLLTLAAWLASTTFTCAISPSDELLIHRKKLPHLIQNYETRLSAVDSFVRSVAPPWLNIELIPIEKPYGPSANRDDVDAVILSSESQHHGPRIADRRLQLGLSPVIFFAVDVVTGDVPPSTIGMSDILTPKLTSSHIRWCMASTKNIVVLINGFVGVGKLTTARALQALIPGSRVLDNHVVSDLADAICSRSNPAYQNLRQTLRRITFDFIKSDIITRSQDVFTIILTSNCSNTQLGQDTAKNYQELALYLDASFIPVILTCSMEEAKKRVANPDRANSSRSKLRDPAIAESIHRKKTIFKYQIPYELELDVTFSDSNASAHTIYEHISTVAHLAMNLDTKDVTTKSI